MAGGVGVEAKNYFVHEPFQDPRLILRERRALRCDDIGNTGLENRYEIELAFADDRAIGLNQASLGLRQAKEHTPFSKKRRLGRVQVFGALRLLFQDTATKRNHFAHIIVNWKHDPVAKPIVGVSFRPILISRLDQTALQNLRAPITAIERPGEKRIPALR